MHDIIKSSVSSATFKRKKEVLEQIENLESKNSCTRNVSIIFHIAQAACLFSFIFIAGFSLFVFIYSNKKSDIKPVFASNTPYAFICYELGERGILHE